MALNWVSNYNILPCYLITQTTTYPNHNLKDYKKSETENPNTKNNVLMDDFRVPLHYPRYTKEDYAKMEEWKLDMLLGQYGFDHHVKGNLDEKRQFAMGAFLWPDQL